MRLELNTANVPPRNRIACVRDFFDQDDRLGALSDQTRNIPAEEVKHHAFGHVVGASAVALIKQTNLGFERQHKSEFADFLIGYQGNYVLEQGQHSGALGAGTVAVLDHEQKSRGSAGTDGSSLLMLMVPKTALGGRAHLIENFSAVPLGHGDPVRRVASDFMASLFREIEAGLDDATAQILMNRGLELMLLVIERGAGRFRKIAPSAYKLALAGRIKHFVEVNLKNPKLSTALAAQAFGISERYVNLLLSLEHTSFNRYVMRRRVECCYDDLRDPHRRSEQIAQIAFDWGFVSQAHFSRSFRQRYGFSPRDCRSV